MSNLTARAEGLSVGDRPSFGTAGYGAGFPGRPASGERQGAALPLRAPAGRPSKRAFDLAASLVLILLLGPLLLLIAIAVRCDGGNALFGHRRMGAAGRTFRCWKFRSMVPDAEAVLAHTLASDPAARAEWDRDFKLRRDPRVTPLGNFLRKSSLDELPQLFNVLKGEMSLVGPRPIVAAEVERYGASIEEYRACKPGITGLWQVSGRNDVDYADRVELDRQYAQTWSLAGDLMILVRTLGVVARRSGAY
ncbi:MAG TPA: sugar transferase [Aliidongia sp.]|uniref:sugar transferase n=1 Tax=Aliidongia sp. TaxID=1914230 RepID=UPI002DDD6ADC|nr:sugar transferase [Aliidongia sp.]HEV2673913.1 sugar transferase [Aliidongia sp.]